MLQKFSGFAVAAALVIAGCNPGENNSANEGTQSTKHVAAETYARAEKLLGPNLVKTVRNGFVTPHWVGERDIFWYRRELQDGHEFLLVDASSGEKRAAFDHQDLADALSAFGDDVINANELPFEKFAFNDASTEIEFFTGGFEYQCALEPVKCSRDAIELQTELSLHGPMSFQHDAEAGPEGVLISPNGEYGIFVRDDDLWRIDIGSGAERQLTDTGEVDFGWGSYPDNRADFIPRLRSGTKQKPVDSHWSPDNRMVLVPRIDQRHVKPYPFIESVPIDGSFRPIVHNIKIPLVGERPASFVWYLIDTDTGEARRIDLPYEELLVIQQDIVAVRDVTWSSDGAKLFLVAHGGNMESAFLFEINVSTGASRVVVSETMSPRMDLNTSTYSPVNVRVLKDGAEALWWSQRSGWGHLYRYNVQTGELLNAVTEGAWLVRDIIDIDEEHGVIYFTGSGREGGNPYYRYFYSVNVDGTGLTLLTPEAADHLLLPNREWVISGDGITPYSPISPSGRYAVYNYSRVDQPTKFVIRDIENNTLVADVEEANVENLMAAGWRAPEEFTVLAPDGETELWGVIYKPSDFDPEKSYPVIDAQYASPLIAITPRHFYQAWRGRQPLAPSSYAELGFIVVSLDARGTINRSRDFLHHGYGALNEIGFADHVHAITELARERPYMDIDRVGVTGHSYGGYGAIRAMLEFPGFFKVGVSSAGMADTHAMYHDYHWTAFHGRPVYSDGANWQNVPTEIPENWKNVAASLQADHLKGKLLIQFGEIDENVPPAQLLQFIDALIAANKDFDMLYLPSRDHQFIGEGYVMRRNWDYMVRNLAGATPPDSYKVEVNGR